MRPSCLYCTSKHLGQAIVLLSEARLGYPHHLWLAIGHLAEAEHELMAQFPDKAEELRSIRLTLMGQNELHYDPNLLLDFLKSIRSIHENELGRTDPDFIKSLFEESL